MKTLLWLMPALPFVGFLLNGLFGKRIPKALAGVIGVGALALPFAFAVTIFVKGFLAQGSAFTLAVGAGSWIQVGDFAVGAGLSLDSLSMMMTLVITGVGFLIHLYSFGYMHEDDAFARFFSYLNLFVFSMLLLVLGSNYLILFVGWEGVGLCSYLLIGFWYKNADYTAAANKAFWMNRIGDLGFLLGLFLIVVQFGSLEFAKVLPVAKAMEVGAPVLTAIGLLLFIGAAGKSAQIPLYTWLPDAMAGPTPVSALIHAATMVTAGVYMILRSGAIYLNAPAALEVVAWVGALTALLAALIALTQRDIKKVLAYSTVSQLGYMVLALGVGAFSSSYFHVFTHAFFKALLFLAAGSVIHALHHEQDLRRMGGLRKRLPITYLTFLIGTLAIAGIPPFAGFFSKDEILAKVFEHDKLLWVVGQSVAFLTAFYMFRLFFLAFHGSFRGGHEKEHHIHESPWTMTLPLVVLAVASTGAGFLGLPHVFGGAHHWLNDFLTPSLATPAEGGEAVPAAVEWGLMAGAVVTSLVAIGLAWFLYVKKAARPAEEGATLPALTRASLAKFYVDEIYGAVIVRPLFAVSAWSARFLEASGLAALMRGVGGTAVWAARGFSARQTGNIEYYLFAMAGAVIAVVFVAYYRLG